jgi:hypothetical protein
MTATRKGLLMALCLAASAIAAPALTSAAVNVDIDIAPPAPIVEAPPSPRVGFVWAPGFYAWRGGRHVWVRGHWIRERPGFHWVPDAWVPAGPHWHYVPGHWVR